MSQTGNKSVVNILPPDSVKDALRNVQGPHTLTPEDSWEVAARPRNGVPTNFGHDMYNSHVLTSNVVGLRATV